MARKTETVLALLHSHPLGPAKEHYVEEASSIQLRPILSWIFWSGWGCQADSKSCLQEIHQHDHWNPAVQEIKQLVSHHTDTKKEVFLCWLWFVERDAAALTEKTNWEPSNPWQAKNTNSGLSRRESTRLGCLRIGHSLLTHGHLMKGENQPACQRCQVPLMFLCQATKNSRDNHLLGMASMNSVFTLTKKNFWPSFGKSSKRGKTSPPCDLVGRLEKIFSSQMESTFSPVPDLLAHLVWNCDWCTSVRIMWLARWCVNILQHIISTGPDAVSGVPPLRAISHYYKQTHKHMHTHTHSYAQPRWEKKGQKVWSILSKSQASLHTWTLNKLIKIVACWMWRWKLLAVFMEDIFLLLSAKQPIKFVGFSVPSLVA